MEKISVKIVAAPVACAEGLKDTWRETAAWASGQLSQRFGEAVQVQYYDLFEAGCPALPAGARLPLVFVNAEVLSSGGKILIPAIRRKIESIIEQQETK